MPTDADGILRTDFRPEMKASLGVGKQELRMRKRPISNRGSLSRRTREAHGEADYAALTVFLNLDAKAREANKLPSLQKVMVSRKKIVFEVDRKTCSRAWYSNAFSRHAQVAIAERQHGERNAKRRKQLYPKRQTNRWKMEREAPQHRLGTGRNTH